MTDIPSQRDPSIPPGTTLGAGVIFTDKTHLTNFSGDQFYHAAWFSLYNILSNTRRKLSLGPWILVGKVPVSKFPKTRAKYKTTGERDILPNILQRMMFHACLKIILSPAHIQNRRITPMIDPDGFLRLVLLIIMGWLADLEEQWDIACVSKDTCPTCFTRHNNLDNLPVSLLLTARRGS